MDNEIASNVLTPEVVMETGKQMRKALLANLTPQETQQLVANNEQIRKQILANTSSDERLAGLTTTELASLLHQTETYLRTHSTDSNH